MDTTNDINFIKSLRLEVNKHFSQNKINKTANLNMYFKSILMLLIYITPYFLMILGYVDSSWFWLCWLMMGVGMAGVGMCIMHDGNHNAFSKNRSVNQIMGFTLQLLGGTYKNWKIQHNQLHHKYPNTIHHDPDVSPIKLLRFSPDSDYRKIYRFQFIYAWFLYGLMTFSFATIKEFKQLFEWSRDGVITLGQFRQLMVELIAWKIMYYFLILVVPMLTLSIGFLEWFSLFFLMHFGVIFSTFQPIFPKISKIPHSLLFLKFFSRGLDE